jgi:hypothetical protein
MQAIKGRLSLVVLSSILLAAYASNAPLYMLSDPKAKCLDGTQAGFYAETASDPADKRKWVIYLNGGGECDNESACKAQLTGSLGSSTYFANTSDSSGWFLGSDYCPYNSDLCGWNHAFDPYCTQDLHSGQIEVPTDDTWGLYFSGFHVFKATLDALDRPPFNLKHATDIVLQGVSAGGIGVWMNLDYLAHRYPAARVSGVTIAGHYFYATYYDGPNHTNPGGMADFRETAFPTTYALYDAFVDESCKEAQEAQGLSPGACMLSNNSFPFIESETFVVQAQTDQVVLTGHDCWPEDHMYDSDEQVFMSQWHDNMTVALSPLMNEANPRNGVFAAACYTHTGFSHSAPLINGISYVTAFGNFYFNRTAAEQYKLSDDCGLMCNPTCM